VKRRVKKRGVAPSSETGFIGKGKRGERKGQKRRGLHHLIISLEAAKGAERSRKGGANLALWANWEERGGGSQQEIDKRT